MIEIYGERERNKEGKIPFGTITTNTNITKNSNVNVNVIKFHDSIDRSDSIRSINNISSLTTSSNKNNLYFN